MSRAATSRAAFIDVRALALLETLVGELRAVRELLEARGVASAQVPATVESPTDELMDLAQVCAQLRLGERSLRRLRAGEGFPSPTSGGHRPRWKRSVIEAWLAQRGAP